jgi:hypothetical protein
MPTADVAAKIAPTQAEGQPFFIFSGLKSAA